MSTDPVKLGYLFAEIVSGHDVSRFDEIVAPGYLNHNAFAEPGPEGVKKVFGDHRGRTRPEGVRRRRLRVGGWLALSGPLPLRGDAHGQLPRISRDRQCFRHALDRYLACGGRTLHRALGRAQHPRHFYPDWRLGAPLPAASAWRTPAVSNMRTILCQ